MKKDNFVKQERANPIKCSCTYIPIFISIIKVVSYIFYISYNLIT